MGVEVAVAGLVLSAIGTAGQMMAAKKTADQQEEIAGQQAASAAQRRIEEKRTAFRRRRLAAANIANNSAVAGVSGSSAESGAISSLGVQGAAERAGFDVQKIAEQSISKSQTKIADLNVQSSIFGSVGSIGNSMYAYSGGTQAQQSPPGVQIPSEE